MRKLMETFYVNKGYKLAIVIFIPILLLSTCGALIQRYLLKHKALHPPTFYLKRNHFNTAFHKTLNNCPNF